MEAIDPLSEPIELVDSELPSNLDNLTLQDSVQEPPQNVISTSTPPAMPIVTQETSETDQLNPPSEITAEDSTTIEDTAVIAPQIDTSTEISIADPIQTEDLPLKIEKVVVPEVVEPQQVVCSTMIEPPTTEPLSSDQSSDESSLSNKTTEGSVTIVTDSQPVNSLRRCHLSALGRLQAGDIRLPGGTSKNMEIDLALGERVKTALAGLTKATENANVIGQQLERHKQKYRKIIMTNDTRLQLVQNRMGMKTALDRCKPYYLAEQAYSKAQEVARLVALQYESATNEHALARIEQQNCEDQLMREVEGAANGASVAISTEVQEALNNAATRVEECRTELLRVESEHRMAFAQVKRTKEVTDNQLEECRAYLDKAQQYFTVSEEVEKDILDAQSELDRLVDAATIARKHVSFALQVLADLTLEVQQLDSPSPSSHRKPSPLQTADRNHWDKKSK
eukprot:Ihof_evm3s518 gene=Ihof_evmTU3s518